MRRLAVFSLFLILSACMSNNVLMTSSSAQKNIELLSNLELGMTQNEVYQIMRYPAREDQITLDDECYDVWFYVTKASILDQSRLLPRNLTPLIFKNGIYVGMGKEYYNHLIKKINRPAAIMPETKEPIESDENLDLEKSIKSFQEQKKTPPATPPARNPSKTTSMTDDEIDHLMAMSSKPKSEPKKGADAEKKDELLDEEDRQMLNEEKQENFNDW